jgi:hypothetical protein
VTEAVDLTPKIVEPELVGYTSDNVKKILKLQKALRESGTPTLKPLLPLLFSLKGKPYSLDNYFPFEPFFRTRIPRATLLKTGRQVSKSTSLAAQGISTAISMPYFSTLYVTPLYEMIRRFSHNYVREFIESSPSKELLVSEDLAQNVLQRQFNNGSNMYFSYAFLDAERTRGIPADKNAIDEVQDIQYDFLQIIHETLSGSPYAVKAYSGTPKTLDNTMEKLWQDSSQAEWIIKCHHSGCNYWNVPSLSHDLLKMLGPWHEEISEKIPGVVCAKCRKHVNPRSGRWVHAYPERRWLFSGYHIPQIILPMHYANPEKWDILIGKSQGRANTTFTTFLNEVCGESYDEGSKLLSETDLKAAAVLPWPNDWRKAADQIGGYVRRVLAVDWGGGGGALKATGDSGKSRTSFTSLAVLGYRADGIIDVLWGMRSLKTHDYYYESQLVVETLNRFRCSHLVHDYGGAGAIRETFVHQAGWPAENIVPIAYHTTAKHNIMTFHPATESHPRHWYSVDKSRALVLTSQCIKFGLIRFFQYDFKSADDPGLIRDFLALLEEKIDGRGTTDRYVIVRHPNLPDDFAQAVNIGSCALWHIAKRWPDLSVTMKFQIPMDLEELAKPRRVVDWEEI